jgi:hypothetical protein
MKKVNLIASVIGLGTTILAGCVSHEEAPSDGTHAERPAAQLAFNEKGEALLPRGYRSWVHVSTSWVPITTSLLDGMTTETPEIFNTYAEPSAFKTYVETGEWPDGTLLAKEFTATSVDAACDGPPAYICKRWYGPAIFQSAYTGVAVMLKDKKRFPNEPGNWAYFSYGHQPPPYEPASPPRSHEQCAQCHIDRAGPAIDYVFSVERIGLDRAGDAKENVLEASLPD